MQIDLPLAAPQGGADKASASSGQSSTGAAKPPPDRTSSDGASEAPSIGSVLQGLWSGFLSLGATLASAVTNLVVVLVGGYFFASSPAVYRSGIVKLFPKGQHERIDDALGDCGRALRLWLIGALLAMALIGLLAGLGTWLIGLPAPLALGLFAGLAQFVPFIGAIIGAVPALILALTGGEWTFLWTLFLFIAIQQVESNMITPLVQRHLLEIPPALLLFAVIAVGLAFGIVGLIVAAPLTIVIFVLVKLLYVRETLGVAVEVPGEDD